MPLFQIRNSTAKWVILILQALAFVIAILWGLSMGMEWCLSPVSLFAAMGFMMIIAACLMVTPLSFVLVRFSKIAAGATAIINTVWIIFASTPVPFWILLLTDMWSWNRERAMSWLTITTFIDLLSVVIILATTLFFMEGYIVEKASQTVQGTSD